MGRIVLAFSIVIALGVTTARAQSIAQMQKEAEIRSAVPFAKMAEVYPTITLGEYYAAVRDLAKEELGLTTAVPAAPNYSAPSPYLPAPYVPSYVPTVPRSSGTTIDPLSGNSYNWRHQPDGSTHVDGMNLYKGSMWQTDIKPNGSMSGFDKDFNPWTYDSGTKTYMNLGTGKMCIGEGLARTCF